MSDGHNWRSVLTDATFGNSLLVTLTVRGDRGPGADGARTGRRRRCWPASCPAAGCSARFTCCRGSASRWRSRCCGAGSWRPPTAPSARCWGTASNGSPIPAWRCRWCRRSSVWTNVGYVALFFLAGILAIPAEIHSAARTDGATVLAAVLAHHPADAAADHVLRAGHRNRQRRTGFRHRLRADRRRARRTAPIWSRTASTPRRSGPRRSAGRR